MADINKVNERMKDNIYMKSILDESEYSFKNITFTLNRKPESYARERKGRGKHFYNPKSSIMEECRKSLIKQMNKEDYDFTREIINDVNKDYTIELDIIYYLPIPKATSIADTIRMIHGIIIPATRPDLDNYNKFLLDVLHEVVYDDDKRVVASKEMKRYSTEPRTEFTVTIRYKVK